MQFQHMNSFPRFIERLFSNSSHQPNGKNKRKRHRPLRIEELEGREMLSADLFNAISTAYGDLDLGDDWEKYNYIEIQADNLTDVAIRNAIATAGTTNKDDIIVFRTTEEQNKITLQRDWHLNELIINIDAAQFGSITIVSLGDKPLTLDATGQSRVFNIDSASNVTLAGLIITGGDAGGEGGGINNAGSLTVSNCTISGNITYDGGGGINNTGSLTVTNCTISKNTAYFDGGGIYNAGSLTISNSTISENTADDSDTFKGGGGIYNITGTTTVTNCTISKNEAYSGGGVMSTGGGTMTFTNGTISENTASLGGGISNWTSTLIFTNSTIEGNTANGDATMGRGNGGGIYQYMWGGTITMTHCVIAGNTADASGAGINSVGGMLTIANCVVENNMSKTTRPGEGGGGIYAAGTFSLANCVVVGNTADNGGGILQTGVFSMTNCVVAGNHAWKEGGGIYQGGSTSSISITNCTVAGNVADLDGGGIYHFRGDLIINNSIVVQNTALATEGLGKDIYKARPFGGEAAGSISGRYNLVGITDGTLALSNAVLGDPKFVAIPATIDAATTGENYNPADWDLRLQSGSAAINKGNNGLAVDAQGQLLTSDLDGNARIVGGTVDLGAYEFRLFGTAPTLYSVESHHCSLEVYWEDMHFAEGYLVQYATDVTFSTNVGSIKADINVKGIFELDPNTVYYVRVAACDSNGDIASDWSNVIEARTQSGEIQDRPTNVKASNVTTTSVTLFWTGVPEAVGYEVQYSWDGGKTWGSKTTSGDTTASVDELVAGVYCMFRVRAEFDEGMSDWSDTVVVQTLSTLPDKPTNVEVTDTAATSVTLSWTGVPDAVRYEIQYSLDGGKSWILGTTSDDISSVNVDKLAADMHYLFRVRAVMSEGGKSDWSDVVVAKTSAAESIAAAAKPKKVAVAKGTEKPTINALTLNISKNMKLAEAGNTASYIVSCTSNPMLKFSYTVTGDKVFIEGLQPGTKYTFAVQAIHINGNVSAATSVKATTVKYTAVKSLKKTATTADSVTLSWKPSTAPAQTTGYVIEVYGSIGGILLDTIPIADVNTTTYTIPELSAGTKYTFVVKATDGVFESVAAKIKVAMKA